MSEAPEFSVVIPTLNRLELLKQTVNSVLAQTYSNYEIIIADNGSTDGTMNYLESFGGGVRVVYQPKKGPGTARNSGVAQAKGQYIAFLDNDDIWLPWTLAIYHEVIQRHQPSMIFGATIEFHDKMPNVERASLIAECFHDYFETANDPQFIGSSMIAVRRNVFERVNGFDESLFLHEDHDLLLRLGTSPGLVRIRSPITLAYRWHAANTSTAPQTLYTGAKNILFREVEGRYPGGSKRKKERCKLLSSTVRYVVLLSLRAGVRVEAWCLYRQSFWINVRAGRFKFLAGFPFYSLFLMMRR
jgi:glycosyltransferase involved in cell wall biosynthesis